MPIGGTSRGTADVVVVHEESSPYIRRYRLRAVRCQSMRHDAPSCVHVPTRVDGGLGRDADTVLDRQWEEFAADACPLDVVSARAVKPMLEEGASFHLKDMYDVEHLPRLLARWGIRDTASARGRMGSRRCITTVPATSSKALHPTVLQATQ